jgi:hypothetical protein
LTRSIVAVFLFLAACSGTGVSPVDVSPDAATGSKDGATGPKDAAAATKDAALANDAGHVGAGDTGVPVGDGGSGPRVYIRINAEQSPFGTPGPSQETPTDQRVGVLGVTLLKTASDPSPLVALDLTTPVEALYNAGSSTLLGSVAASDLVAGTYTVVRIPVAYVNFTVGGTAHYGAISLPGDLNDIICLTDGTTLDGAVRDRGWFSSTFTGAGHTYGPTLGEDSAIAQPGSQSHIGLDLSQTVAAYVFPLTLVIPATITHDMEIVFTANTYEDFHWQDQATAGFTAGVFDITATSYEPVTQLGANSATVTIMPVTTP